MTVSLFSFVDIFSRALAAADHLLDKGLAHAKATGVSEQDMLGWRLIDDMQTLRFQIGGVVIPAQQWPARAAGLPVPANFADDLDVAGLKAAIADVRAFLADLKPTQFEGRDDMAITVAIGPGIEPTLGAGRWMTVFANTNLMFHLSIAYAILRAKGVPLGKPDLFASGL
jgi:hypothetical protein